MENLDLERIEATARRVGVPELARVAGLPQSTVRSFCNRERPPKSLSVFEKLIAAADRLEAVPPAGA
jgi:hypothetical protein